MKSNFFDAFGLTAALYNYIQRKNSLDEEVLSDSSKYIAAT